MNRAIVAHKLQPIIDSTFNLDQAAEAFRHMKSGQHFGKIGVTF